MIKGVYTTLCQSTEIFQRWNFKSRQILPVWQRGQY